MMSRKEFLLSAAGGMAGVAVSSRVQAQDLVPRFWAAIAYLTQANHFTPWVFGAGLANNVDCGHDEDELAALEPVEASNWAMMILAAQALSVDPRDLYGRDLVAGLTAALAATHTLNADAWGVIALREVGMPISHPLLVECRDRMISAFVTNQGWGGDVSQPNSNDTAAVLLALSSLGLNFTAPVVASGFSALALYQNPDGGMALAMGAESDSCSDAWAAAACQSFGLDCQSFFAADRPTVISHLVGLQQADGSFNHTATQAGNPVFRATATAYALVALAGKTWPTTLGSQPNPDPVTVKMPLCPWPLVMALGGLGCLARWRQIRLNQKP
ncbi:MAG: hypothetical protein WCX71_01370 [Candidatus Buchananbacteria bacterium]